MVTALERTAGSENGWSIDPFGAEPHHASRIGGLGGADHAPEPGYVFRTLPTRPSPGAATFVVTLRDLAATHGHLSIDLTVTPAQEGTASVKLRTVVVALEELAANGAAIELPFDARRNMLYGMAGFIHGDSDVAASAIEVVLRAGGIDPAERAPLPHHEGGPPADRIESVEIARLTDLDAPSFRDPVSQPRTREQSRHPDLHQWVRELGFPRGVDDDTAWAHAFPIQVLSRYGMLRPGARGLGIDVRGQTIPALLARLECSVLAVERARPDMMADPGELLESLHRNDVCGEDRFYAAVHSALIDPARPELPQGFNFAWSVNLDAAPHDVEEVLRISLDHLAPGGLAIHVFPFAPLGSHDTTALQRRHVERLALGAISHRHEVAQLKFRLPPEDRRRSPQRLAYGLIVQRC